MLERLILKAAIFEQLNTIFKSQMYHEIMIQDVEKLKAQEALTSKEKYQKEKAIADVINRCKEDIKRAQKYNNEVNKIINKNTNLSEFVENYSDVINELINCIIANPGVRSLKDCVEVANK